MTMIAKKIDEFTDHIIDHGFITRNGGASQGLFHSMNFSSSASAGDNKENVEHNFQILANHYALQRSDINHINQVHSANVIKIISKNAHDNDIKADAMVTNLPNTMLLIKTADCCPILFKDPINKIIGAAHAGWRGAFSGIIESTIANMLELGADIKNIEAAIGPTIRQATYEVDDVFYDTFIKQDSENKAFFIASINEDKYMFDLPLYCVSRLNKSGVFNVHDININTYEHEDEFYSCRRAFHRGENGFGVQGSVIMIRE